MSTEKYFTSSGDFAEGQTVKITTDLDVLKKAWKESELGPNDELESYLGVIGKVIEIEEDDDTAQLRWENLDTAWIPFKACADAMGAKPTVPGTTVSWLDPNESDIEYFKSVNDVKEGDIVRVASNLDHLTQCWKESQLGPNDELQAYCGMVGKVMEIEDGDETLQVRWENLDTVWMPAKACYSAPTAELTSPGINISWLSPDQEENKGLVNDEANDTEANETTEVNDTTDENDTAGYETSVHFYTSVEDGVTIGQTVQVTRSEELLRKCWEDSELGPNDELKAYLGGVGKVSQIEEDDDTIELTWENLDTVWIPVRACFDAKGKKPTVPKINMAYDDDEE